jgi:hypothetical protein
MPGLARIWYQSSATPATDLATLATGRARFVGCPLVCRPLLVRRAATLARDLALLLRRHGCEPASFLAYFFHGLSPALDHQHQPRSRRGPSPDGCLSDLAIEPGLTAGLRYKRCARARSPAREVVLFESTTYSVRAPAAFPRVTQITADEVCDVSIGCRHGLPGTRRALIGCGLWMIALLRHRCRSARRDAR